MEDFLELEEFLELEDGGEEIWKLHQRLALIDTNLMRSIDNQPTSSINAHSISSIDTQQIASIYIHTPSSIDTHPRSSIDTHRLKNYRIHKEADGFHKRVKMIHDPVKFGVPCTVVEVEFPLTPDKGAHLSPYVEVLDDHQHIEASQRGLRFRDEVDKDPTEAASVDTDRIPLNDTKTPASIDITTSPSNDTGCISEQKEFDVRENLRRYHHAIRQVWGKEEEEFEKEKVDQGRSSVIIDPSLLRWCQEIHSAQQMLLTTICKALSTHPSRRLLSTSTDDTSLTSIDRTSDPTIDWIFIVSNDCSNHRPMRPCRHQSTALHQQRSIEPKLTSNTKLDSTACFGAWKRIRTGLGGYNH
ncbi:hypothetical protein IGI04_029998 [Brassica rapa subsp. trilocularis]|uniref:Uncharacterized protein n=1 Tax=Brassica rapa subsp. trilocularis TaxID=1813537 RepID=A0ABQ7LPF7_BRACM|nr:hypothetical protein IGI04_029998 [Brassica rapa subsp. trilocularis]